jgi:hypothetical protein
MKRKPPACIDTGGNDIPRVCFAALQRVMDDPRNVTARSPYDYAVVFCEALGISLSRDGRTIQKAAFFVTTCHPYTSVSAVGAEGRDWAINYFLGLLRKRKSFVHTEEHNGTPMVHAVQGASRHRLADDALEVLTRPARPARQVPALVPRDVGPATIDGLHGQDREGDGLLQPDQLRRRQPRRNAGLYVRAGLLDKGGGLE